MSAGDDAVEVLVVRSRGSFGIPLEVIDRLVPAAEVSARPLGELLGRPAPSPLRPDGPGADERPTHALVTKSGFAALVDGSGELVSLPLRRIRRLPSLLRRPGVFAAALVGPSTVLLLLDLDRIPSRKEPTC